MFGVYIHFPYCRKRCPYCDFAVQVRRRIPHEQYADAVLAELSRRAPLFPDRRLVSVFFGGGTPSLWEEGCVARVLRGVLATFAAAPEIEVTLEANPDDLPRSRLDALRRAGVNRLSIGAESFSPASLARLGRLHGPSEIVTAVALARAAGFDNLAVDLMYGLPNQTTADLDGDLDALLDLRAEHLSIYQLTVEERTPFGALRRAGTLHLPEAERLSEMAERVDARATAAGYAHYEISNYALPGRRAVHNTLYWSGGEWLGLGASAHSFRRLDEGGERFATVKGVDAYLGAAGQPREAGMLDGDPLIAHREPLDADALAREAIWLGLRLLEDGVDRLAFAGRFGADPAARFPAEIEPLAREGLVELSAGRLRLTRRGALFADEIALRFL